MNLILLGFLVGTSGAVKASSLFIIAHTILSTIFFLFSDSVYKRFSSRSTSAVRGLLQTTPSLGYFLFASCLLFAGLPFTLKFVVEVYIFTQLFNTSSVLVVVTIFIANWFGIISFMKN
jgi:hydrogenase-4 component F